jgi:hypothetical protein
VRREITAYPEHHLLWYSAFNQKNATGANMGRKTADGGFDPAIDAELAILASIETRYSEELASLQKSPKPPEVRERLREQLEARRKMAREPHVLRLAALHEQMQTRTLFSIRAKH